MDTAETVPRKGMLKRHGSSFVAMQSDFAINARPIGPRGGLFSTAATIGTDVEISPLGRSGWRDYGVSWAILLRAPQSWHTGSSSVEELTPLLCEATDRLVLAESAAQGGGRRKMKKIKMVIQKGLLSHVE
jgi:hypothetical protein